MQRSSSWGDKVGRPQGRDELLIKALMPLFLQGFLLVILEKMALIEPIVSDDGSVTTKVFIIIIIIIIIIVIIYNFYRF